jgi:transposase
MNIIGIDVSKAKLGCAWLGKGYKLKAKTFPNAVTGWQGLVGWSLKNTGLAAGQLHFVMEATGVYHERLATWPHDAGAQVSAANPAQVKFYAQGLGVRTENDKKDSVALARYGLKENPKPRQPEALEIRTLKALIARLDGVEKGLQRGHNRQGKALASDAPGEVLKSLAHMAGLLAGERQRLERLIEGHLDKHEKLKVNKALLGSIPGAGKAIATRMPMVIGGRQFDSAGQCSAYLGLVPVQHESGSGVRGLAKAGNPIIRAKPYMAAIVATAYNPDIKAQSGRLAGNGKSKMSALGAAMRKLVQICFGVLKHQLPYQPQVG